MLPGEYRNRGPIDCPAEVDYGKVKGRTVIVTGGSKGLGHAYVTAFADGGAFVVNGDLMPPAEQYTAANILYVKCDVTSWEDQVALFEAAMTKSPNGGIDIVVANAGVFREDQFFAGFESLPPTKLDLKMVNTHVYGTYTTSKLAAHYFSRQSTDKNDRCLILVGSVMSYLDTYGAVGYGLAKHAIRGLMGVLRRRRFMRVNMIAPWYTPTTVNTPEYQKVLEELFASQSLSFALIEDAVKAVLRIATDPSVNGRALSNVPRTIVASGYLDLDSDDFQNGSLLDRFQKSVAEIEYPHLISPKSKL